MRGLALEMIITLIMLLVVAGVIISIFVSQVGDPNKIPNVAKDQLIQQKFLAKCESLCNGINNKVTAAAFCEEHAGFDWDNNNIISQTEILRVDPRMQVCENRIYCFQVYDCNRIQLEGKEKYQVQACVRLSCESQSANAASPQDADKLVAGPSGKIVTGATEPGSACKLDFPTWHDRYVTTAPCSAPAAQ